MISLLIVNFRSASLAAGAIRTARATTCAPLEVVVVDNSCDNEQVRTLEPLADRVIAAERNLGYAGAINLGRRSCNGATLIVSNADVLFGHKALDGLERAVLDGAALAGPALFWDDGFEWILPPADMHTAASKIDEVLASRSRGWSEQRDRRRIRSRIRFWSLTETTEVRAVSGAVMAIACAEFDALGGFDERFGLYYEETDFQRRLLEMEKRIVYVPQARCRHLYNQSAGQDPEAAGAAFAAAESRYLEKWLGPFAARTLKRFERPARPHSVERLEGPIVIDRDDVIVEVSPQPHFATAAGTFPRAARIDLPEEVWRTVGSRPLYFRTIDRRDARVLASYVRDAS